MTGLAALLNRDSTPVDEAVLRRMLAALDRYGSDHASLTLHGRAGLANALLATTPEAVGTQQPHSLDGQVWVTAQARLDDRPALLRRLRAEDRDVAVTDDDATLLLHAYAVWGDDCPAQLVGDFAFVIWDARRDHLLAARDPIGSKRLYYCERPGCILIATDIAVLLAALPDRPPLNPRFLPDMLAGHDATRVFETVYSGIFPVRAAHRLIVDEHVRQSRYYDWDDEPTPRYRTDTDYIEHFRDLLAASLTAQTRASTPVAVEVSGGLDSSSLAALLHHLAGMGRLPTTDIRLVSQVSERFPNVNRRHFLDQMRDHCQPWPLDIVNPDEQWALRARNNVALLDEPPTGSLTEVELNEMRAVRAAGARVLLSGAGADEVLLGEGYFLPELFHLIPPRDWPTEWRAFGGLAGRKRTLLYGVLLPVLTDLIGQRRFCQLGRAVPGGLLSYGRGSVPGWVHAPPLRCDDRTGFYSRFTYNHRDVRSVVRAILWCGFEQAAFVNMGRLENIVGVERRRPFFYRPLVAFLMGLPPRFLLRDGQDKWLLRQALHGLMPDAIRLRPSSGTFQPLVDSGWRNHERSLIEALLAHPLAAAAGWLDPVVLRDQWAAYWAGQSVNDRWVLAIWINIELWLRQWQGAGFPVDALDTA